MKLFDNLKDIIYRILKLESNTNAVSTEQAQIIDGLLYDEANYIKIIYRTASGYDNKDWLLYISPSSTLTFGGQADNPLIQCNKDFPGVFWVQADSYGGRDPGIYVYAAGSDLTNAKRLYYVDNDGTVDTQDPVQYDDVPVNGATYGIFVNDLA